MKRFILFLFLLVVLSIPTSAISGPVYGKLIDAVTISASGSSTSAVFPTNGILNGVSGFFTLQYAITGDGTAKIEYLSSLDGTNYIEPSSATDIATGLTKTSGSGSDGKDVISFSPIAAPKYKIKVTETGGANSITITVWGFFY